MNGIKARKVNIKLRPQDMRIFVAIGSSRTLTEAADELKIPLFTVSRALKRIEVAAQVVLIRRDGAGLHLSELGQEYLRACQSALQAHQSAVDVLFSQNTEPDGTLQVVAPVVFVQEVLSALLPEFLKSFPKLRVNLIANSDSNLGPKAAHDVFLRAGMPHESPHLMKLFPAVRQGLFASPKYLAVQANPVHPLDLTRHDCLGHSPSEILSTWTFSRANERFPIDPNARVTITDPATLCRLALASAGITTLPVWMAREYVNAGALVEVLPDWTLEPMVFCALYNGRLRPGSKESAFLNFLASVLGGPNDPRCRGANPEEFFVRSQPTGPALQNHLQGRVDRPAKVAPLMLGAAG